MSNQIKILSIIVLIFTLIAIATTSFLINKNTKHNNAQITNGEQFININPVVEESGIDLNGTYDQNDLIINKLTEDYQNIKINIPQIEGLKDESIENKINTELKARIYQKLDSIPNISSCNFITLGNFANIISICCNIYSNNNQNYDTIYLNYELVNGSQLNFEDIFKKDTDILSIVRSGFYEAFLRNNLYNFESNEIVDENEVYRNVKYFMNQEEKNFGISPTHITIKNKNYGFYIELNMIDLANEVVVYNKYLTKESIFSKDSIGHKNIFTCATSDYDLFDYIEYGFIEDNFWSDITGPWSSLSNIDEDYEKKLKMLGEDEKTKLYNQIEAYRKIAKANPDKFYIYLNKQYIMPYSKSVYSDDDWTYKYSYITSVANDSMFFEMPMSVYENTYKEKIIDSYRSEYFTMRGGVLIEAVSGDGATLTQNQERTVINLNSGEKIEKLEDIFYEDSDYMNIIKNKVASRIESEKIQADNIDELLNTATFDFTNYCVSVNLPGFDFTIDINYQDFDDAMIKLWVISKSRYNIVQYDY